MNLLKQPSELYLTSEFRALRESLMSERTNADGFILCAECGNPIVKKYDCIAHHHIPVNAQNMNDITITLNPENIRLVHHDCHNKIHSRFGYSQRKVYIVHGAPLSGKTSYVQEHKGNSDLIVDADNIWQCITGCDRYAKPNALKSNFFTVRDCLLDMVQHRVGKWETAWIISSEVYQTPLESMCKKMGGELIEIDTDKESCLKRLYEQPDGRDIALWERLIDKYFEAR